ncbi:TVP38/TMEM64 family protein [Gluconacetobacter entanii]|nr:VTT domain-containing protein [Gluconacetobacter entanii]NPC88765.1 TVP38/TMEM64 family protein [Gluconacetobacter entanii]
MTGVRARATYIATEDVFPRVTRSCRPPPSVAHAPSGAPSSAAAPRAGLGVLLRPALMVALAVAVVVAVRAMPGLRTGLEMGPGNVAMLRDGIWGRVWFVLAGTAFCALGLPRQAVCLAAGMAYGTAAGMALATCATVAGGMADFLVARAMGRMGGGARLPPRVRDMCARLGRPLRERTFSCVLVLRLLPVGSAMMLSIAAGLAGARAAGFIAATLLGSLPQTVVFVLVGGGTEVNHQWQVALAVVLFVISGLGGVWLLRASRIARADRTT